jgi:outer membrane protein
MIKLFAIALINIGLLSSALASSLPDSSQALTLEQCLAIAKANNLTLQKAQKSHAIAELARMEISTTAYPQVKVQAGGTYAPSSSRHGYDPAITDQGQLSGQVVVEQSLYDGGIRSLKKTQADLDIKRLTKEQMLALKDLELNITQVFVEALRAQSELALRTEGQSTLSDYYLLVKSLHAAGTVGLTDVLSTQARLLSDSLLMIQAAQNMIADKLTLAELMGIASDTSYSLAGNLDGIISQLGDSLNKPASLDSLQNLELSVAGLEYKRSLLDVRATQKEIIPTLSLMGDLGYLSSRNNLLLPPSERVNGVGYEVGVTLSMPIFDWGGRKLRIRQLELTSESIRTQGEILRHSLLSEFKTALSGLSSARTRLRLAEAAINTASDNFSLIKAKYVGGSALTLEVLDAYQILTEARLAKLDVLAEIATLGAKLQRINAHE